MDKPKARLAETTEDRGIPRRPWVPPHISAESTTITNHLKRPDHREENSENEGPIGPPS